MKVGKMIMVIGLLAMTYGLYNGFVNGDFLSDGKELMENPWGLMSLIDIYVAMLMFATWILFREKYIWMALFWCLLLIVLGSFAAALYGFLDGVGVTMGLLDVVDDFC